MYPLQLFLRSMLSQSSSQQAQNSAMYTMYSSRNQQLMTRTLL
jgi:hypothetical protein